MSEAEKHVTITERCFEALHIVQERLILAERILLGAICFIQASTAISCDRDFSDPIHVIGHTYEPRIGFTDYGIEGPRWPGDLAHFVWKTTSETSTSYKWRLHEGPGEWVDHPDTPATLSIEHEAQLTGPMLESTDYDFIPYGKDVNGDTYSGRMVGISYFGDEWAWGELE